MRAVVPALAVMARAGATMAAVTVGAKAEEGEAVTVGTKAEEEGVSKAPMAAGAKAGEVTKAE